MYGSNAKPGAGGGTRTPTSYAHENLNLACLPIPPRPRGGHTDREVSSYITLVEGAKGYLIELFIPTNLISL